MYRTKYAKPSPAKRDLHSRLRQQRCNNLDQSPNTTTNRSPRHRPWLHSQASAQREHLNGQLTWSTADKDADKTVHFWLLLPLASVSSHLYLHPSYSEPEVSGWSEETGVSVETRMERPGECFLTLPAGVVPLVVTRRAGGSSNAWPAPGYPRGRHRGRRFRKWKSTREG
jgi:hypothetical protein